MRACLLACCLLAACTSAPVAPPFTFSGSQATPAGSDIAALVETGRGRVEGFFGQPFMSPVSIVIAPTRAAFDTSLPAKWELTPTQCWMVGVGGGNMLALLSPSAWAGQACEHDGKDARHIQEIITHELVHVYHGQRNPTGDFMGMDDAGWFVEGLAVLVSGQLDDGKRPAAADAIASGAAPSKLADAWSGKFRYGISGSMVAYIDSAYGRPAVIDLLPAITNEQILHKLGVTEAEFLARWRNWVTRPR